MSGEMTKFKIAWFVHMILDFLNVSFELAPLSQTAAWWSKHWSKEVWTIFPIFKHFPKDCVIKIFTFLHYNFHNSER